MHMLCVHGSMHVCMPVCIVLVWGHMHACVYVNVSGWLGLMHAHMCVCVIGACACIHAYVHLGYARARAFIPACIGLVCDGSHAGAWVHTVGGVTHACMHAEVSWAGLEA